MKLVMLVDDEEMTRMFVKKILKKQGYEICEASSGGEALDMIMEITPDVVIIDMNMPDMNGLTLAGKMRGTSCFPRTTSIMMLSGQVGIKHEMEAIEYGINEIMSKPFDLRELISNVERLAARNIKIRSEWEEPVAAASGANDLRAVYSVA
jgi:chemosensory pili system protein ChpA (sensor histidine kinase/response regulator)